MKENLKRMSLGELEETVENLGIERYRAPQIFQWLWQKNAKEFSEMTNLSRQLRKSLEEKFVIAGLKIEQRLRAADGTTKFLFKLEDDKYIESVYIPESKRRTICVSTQVGCALRCKFCATAQLGFARNLKAYEITEQVQIIQKESGAKMTNIVFMGMGEPLLNLKEVAGAAAILSSPIGLSISQRHITVSTVGIVQGIRNLLASPSKLKLAISLNFADERTRTKMMPVTATNPLSEVLKLAREYSTYKSMVTFEYVMIEGLNDKITDAKKLLKLLKGIPSKINLIPYNAHPLLPYKPPSPQRIEEFCQYLLTSKHTVTLRKSRGQEILAGCGQLAGKEVVDTP